MTYVLLGLKRAFSARILISLLCVLVHISNIKGIHNHVLGVYIVIRMLMSLWAPCLWAYFEYEKCINYITTTTTSSSSSSSFSTTLCTVISNRCILTACRN